MKYVIVFGDLFTGIQTIHGPFTSTEMAKIWAGAACPGEHYTIHPLRTPS